MVALLNGSEPEVEINRPALRRNIVDFATTGDFGGTKERLALYGKCKSGEVVCIVRVDQYASHVKSVAQFLDYYHKVLKREEMRIPSQAVFGWAGVQSPDGKSSKLTNGRLKICTDELPIKVRLVNDFYANAAAIPFLDLDDRKQVIKIPHIHGYKPNENKDLVVPGPGTGLGEAPLYFDVKTGKYTPKASEGGHTTWSPRPGIERSLDRYLREEVTDGKDPTFETVASGQGIFNIVNFLANGHIEEEQGHIASKIKDARRKSNFRKFVASLEKMKPEIAGREIIQYHKDGAFSRILDQAVNIFVDATALASRNAVESFCAYGGVYIAGGNARRLKDSFLEDHRFMETFENPYKHANLLRRTPVYIITTKTLGTDGAAHIAFGDI